LPIIDHGGANCLQRGGRAHRPVSGLFSPSALGMEIVAVDVAAAAARAEAKKPRGNKAELRLHR